MKSNKKYQYVVLVCMLVCVLSQTGLWLVRQENISLRLMVKQRSATKDGSTISVCL